jgi:hypothetical protein
MPFTPAQLVTGANYSLATYQKKDPIDQVNFQHATLEWLLKNKEVSTFGNGSFKEPIYISNNSNAQNYFGADQVTYNERDPAKWTDFTWFNMHDGFWFDEDRLLAAGITVKDDSDSIPTSTEKETLIDLLKVSYKSLKMGMQEALAFETLRDGSQSSKAVPGLAFLVDPTPATGIVGGIDASTNPYWQNNADIGIAATAGLILTEMEKMWQACQLYGGMVPDFIVCGAAFLAKYKLEAGITINRQIHDGGNMRGGVTLDASINDAFFHGVPLVWDPTFEKLDALMGTTTQTKTCYFLNSNAIKFRPVKNNWMVDRKPERLPDRYVHYFAKTSKYGFTVNRRNALAVLSIA